MTDRICTSDECLAVLKTEPESEREILEAAVASISHAAYLFAKFDGDTTRDFYWRNVNVPEHLRFKLLGRLRRLGFVVTAYSWWQFWVTPDFRVSWGKRDTEEPSAYKQRREALAEAHRKGAEAGE